MKNHYDIIIIWAWASGLFTAIESPSYLSKLILEKNRTAGSKILLSGWERANVSNIDIDPLRDYFGQNKKALISLFKRYNNYDFISYLSENRIYTVEEDRGRIILESWNSKELLDYFLKKIKQNHTEIIYNSQVIEVIKNDKFEIKTVNWDKYTSDKLVITTWWKSFSQVGTTWDWYEWAQKFGHTVFTPFRWLCALVTKKDLTDISWISTILKLEVISKITNKVIYFEEWPLLFTHFWISGPIIFNSSNAIWEYINSMDLTEFINNLDFTKIQINEKYDYITRNFIKDNITLKLIFNLENSPKRVVKFFDLNTENSEIIIKLQDCRTWKEAKVTWWWVKIDELTNNLESKIVPWLYFAWEILDITWKTGWFNLQFAWTSWHIVGKNLL